MCFTRENHRFDSHGLTCAAWLYRPEQEVDREQVIIMAHGVAAEKSFGLPAFAERFAALGFTVFLFDYRNLGDSEGEPRNWVSHWRHAQDWDSAINYMRRLPGLEGTKPILWGSSFGGGHAISAAARHDGIRAVVAQVPFVDNVASVFAVGLLHATKGLAAALLDVGLYLLTGRSFTVPVVGRPSQFAAMNTAESYDGYMRIVPEGSNWRNRLPARFFLSIGVFSPLRRAARVTCRALIIAGKDDSLSPLAAVKKTAERMPQSRYVEMTCNHLQPYVGEYFEENIRHQIRFLKELAQ
jgi:pimeloyl-ACP methyl ester carboxylesterase